MFHENHDDPVAAILESPIAPAMLARLQSALETERQHRLQFYQDIDDDMKAEFINGEVIIHSPVKKEHTDVVFFGSEKSDVFQKGQWKYPVPDFAVEVLSEGTEKRDRGVKFKDYEAHGVQEYWIIDPVEESVEQYFLQNGQFKLHLKTGQGTIESRVVAGFSIDIRAIFDEKTNLEALRKIIGSV